MDCPYDYKDPVKRTADWTNPLNGVTYVYCWVTCSNNVMKIEE